MLLREVEYARPASVQHAVRLLSEHDGARPLAGGQTNHRPPLMVALGVTMTVAGPDGERQVPARDFFLGVYMTAVGPGELLTKIAIPAGKGDGFAAVTIGKDGTCIVNAAASLDGGTPRVAIGCVDAVPVVVEAD